MRSIGSWPRATLHTAGMYAHEREDLLVGSILSLSRISIRACFSCAELLSDLRLPSVEVVEECISALAAPPLPTSRPLTSASKYPFATRRQPANSLTYIPTVASLATQLQFDLVSSDLVAYTRIITFPCSLHAIVLYGHNVGTM